MADIDGNLLDLPFSNSSANRELPGSLLLESSGVGIAQDQISVTVENQQAIVDGAFYEGFAGTIEALSDETTVRIDTHPPFGFYKVDVVVHVEDTNEQPEAEPEPPHHFATVFDGTNEYALGGDFAILKFERTNQYSISCWASWTVAGVLGILVGKMGNLANNRGYDVHTNTLGGINMNLNSDNAGGNKIGVRTTTAFNNGALHHILVTYDGSSTAAGCHMWVDGVDQPVIVYADNLTTTIVDTAPLMFGARLEPGLVFPFTGTLDEVSIWNTALAGDRVQEIYNGGCPGNLLSLDFVSSLLGWWQMGDGTGSAFPSITDASINSNTMTLTNMEAADVVGVVYPGC